MSRANLRIHAFALAAIIFLLVLIAVFSHEETQVMSPYYITVSNATYGMNCKLQAQQGDQTAPGDPYMAGNELPLLRKNNVLTTVSQMCNDTPYCEVPVKPETFGIDPDPACNKELEVEYRCFSYDRPRTAKALDLEKAALDCTSVQLP